MRIGTLLLLIILTPLIFWLSHFFAFFIHEYSHSFSAWVFGFKANPLLLNFGDWSWENILTFDKMDENVNFPAFAPAHPWIASFVAVSGFAVGNLFLLIVSIKALYSKKPHSALYYYFFLWLAVMNLGNFNDYVPARVFGTHGDMQEIVSFLNISPWWLMVVLGYPICFSFWYFYSYVLPRAYFQLKISLLPQAGLLCLVSYILFGLFGMAGHSGYGAESTMMAHISFYMLPIVIVACWPSRDWVKGSNHRSRHIG